METLDRLSALLAGEASALLDERRAAVTEIRLRANRPAQIVSPREDTLVGGAIDAGRLAGIVSALMDYSFYAREYELSQGFFTLNDGSRVGVCGRFVEDGGRWRLTDVGSACVRVARPVPGCADALMGVVCGKEGLRSTLLLSPPGMGKTTLLRDIARQLSEGGYSVGVADERHELAACRLGVPTLDLGPRTDVLDGCPRPMAIRRLIRSMAPRIIVADEIGGAGDADALADAARCGIAVIASAHGDSFEAALARPWLREVLSCDSFRAVALLGDRPGAIREIRRLDEGGDARWKSA